MYIVTKSLFFLLIIFTFSAYAENYYVDATHGSDSNSGSHTAPWKRIAKVNTTSFSPGDHIKFKRGQSWAETLKPSSSGTTDKPIVYEDYGTGPLPRITGAKNEDCIKWNTKRNSIVFRNLNLHNCGNGGVNVWNEAAPSRDITIEGCIIEHAKKWNIFMSGVNGLRIRNNVIRNAELQHGIYLDGYLGVHNATIENNDIYANKAMCVQFNSNGVKRLRGIVLRYNKLHDCGKGGVNNIGAINLLAHHNLIYGDMSGIYNGCDARDTGCSAGATGGKYFNNTIVTSGSSWATCFENASSLGIPNFKEFKNNICVHNAKKGLIFAHEESSGSAISDYNMFYSGPGASTQIVWNSRWYSNFREYQSSTGQDKHSLFGDPIFKNALDAAFQLSAKSPATDTGIPLIFNRDLDGNPVPMGSGPERGAYEYYAGGVPATPSGPPRVSIEF